jgi:hypothetical protein
VARVACHQPQKLPIDVQNSTTTSACIPQAANSHCTQQLGGLPE